MIYAGNTMFYLSHSPRGTRTPEPLRIPRPGAEPPKKVKATSADMARFFGGAIHHDQNGGDP